jgi:hypothetical protein
MGSTLREDSYTRIKKRHVLSHCDYRLLVIIRDIQEFTPNALD